MPFETWQESKRWADGFIPHVKILLGWNCIQVASIQADRRENTDLMFDIDRSRFAVRIRRLTQRLTSNYRNEVTFRLSRPSGSLTELAKLMVGWGDYFFYGWGDERSHRVVAYTILDLDALRGWLFSAMEQHGRLPGQRQSNRDGSASFYPLCLDCVPPAVIVHRYTVLPDAPPIQDSHWRLNHASNRHPTGVLRYA